MTINEGGQNRTVLDVALSELEQAAKDVCAYDWCDNDDDAVTAISSLDKALKDLSVARRLTAQIHEGGQDAATRKDAGITAKDGPIAPVPPSPNDLASLVRRLRSGPFATYEATDRNMQAAARAIESLRAHAEEAEQRCDALRAEVAALRALK